MPSRIAKQIYNTLVKAEKVLLVPHQDPDGDALGSVSALAQWLVKEGKEVQIFCSTIGSVSSDLPLIELTSNNPSLFKNTQNKVIVVLDTGDLKHAGLSEYVKNNDENLTIINIDHHPTNEMFGRYNLVIDKASSTTEILHDFFYYNNIEISDQMATALLVGIVSDTDNFTNSATNKNSLKIAGNLINQGAELHKIQRKEKTKKPKNLVNLWGETLCRFTLHPDHEIAYSYITYEDIQRHNVKENELRGIANFLNSLSEGKAGLILKELQPNKVSGSFRTTRNDIDVAKIAKELGGGGHKKAAGFTINGSIEDALKQVWRTIERQSKTCD